MASQAAPQAVPASPYVPRVARLAEVKTFTSQEKFFRFRLEDGQGIEYRAGQFMEVSVFGRGEAPISICSVPGTHDELEMCIRAVGDVTNALHGLKVGDSVGMRGAFGNGFDMDSIAGKDLLFVAGGLGLAPCRSFILGALNDREKFRRVTILYGARTPADLLFREDLDAWAKRDDVEFLTTVDRPDESWTGHKGVITLLFKKIAKVKAADTAAFIIGPPIMFKFAVLEALAMGLRRNNIYCSLERRMKCGMGKCGHCQIRGVYVCQDGPIFSYAEVLKLREGI
ncbi:MAG TPA: FAD/NAD(P)-binding protein [Phycisphaerae bacterium]|nr:FAD/NAD(P)-binding protein [Phycisphaerae bacterium]